MDSKRLKFNMHQFDGIFFRYLLVDIFFLLTIFFTIYLFTNFQYGKYIFAGDFRLDIHREHVGENFLSLMSEKFSTNNFVYSSFYPLYFILQFIPYHVVIAYVFIGIPILLYVSLKYTLLKMTNFFKEINRLDIYIFYSTLAFYFSVNPALFERYVHWPFLQSEILLPLFIYVTHKMFIEKNILNRYSLLLPFLLYFGAIAPQFVIVYTITAFLVFIDYLICCSEKKWLTILSKLLIFFIWGIISFFHTFYLIFSGYGVTKSFHESETTSDILGLLSRNSSVFSAVSGTNFFESFIRPYPLSVGFLVFFFSIFLIVRRSNLNKRILYLFFISLSTLILISGYMVFPQIFNIILVSYLKNFLWTVKDPNMYYLLFVLVTTLLAVFLFKRDILFKNTKFIWILSGIFFILNILSIFSFDKEKFNHYFDFIDIPHEYIELSDELEFSEGRNLWLPYDWYVQKSFTIGQTHFPNPAFWLTKNKELIDFNDEYKKFIDIIKKEVYEKNCKNIYFLDWIMSAQKLNIIVDRNNDIEKEVILTDRCMQTLPNVYKYKNIGNITIYKSSLKILNEFTYYPNYQNTEALNNFLKDHPVNIVSKGSIYFNGTYSILNEAYDDNWRNADGDPPLFRVNLFSMAFAGNNDTFSYRGEIPFQRIVLLQKIIILLTFLFACLLFVGKYRRNTIIKK